MERSIIQVKNLGSSYVSGRVEKSFNYIVPILCHYLEGHSKPINNLNF
jgi:hypothetical protein